MQGTAASSSGGTRQTPPAHTIPLQTQFEQLHSSPAGLTSQEARKRLDIYGTNDTSGARLDSGLVQFLRLFLNRLIMILIIASIVSAALGDR